MMKIEIRLRTLMIALLVVTAVTVKSQGTCSYSENVCKNIKWTGGEHIAWPCPMLKKSLKRSEQFISKNILAMRFAVNDDNAYVAMPR